MPGAYVTRTWQHNPTLNAPAKYRRACNYRAFVPTRLGEISIRMEGTVAGVVSEAEAAIHGLNEPARPALTPLARLLLRTESIASSKIEGMQMGIRDLVRAETKMEGGATVGRTASEVLANIDAMELAVEEAVASRAFTVEDIKAIHKRLMARAMGADRIAGQIRTDQDWIGGNDYNPCGAEFVPPPPEEVPGLLDDLCQAINEELLPPIVQAALVHAQFETVHPFADGNGRTGRALIHVVLKRRGTALSYMPPISVVLAHARDRYIGGLTRFREDEDGTVEWVEQFAAAAYSSARLASAYLEEVRNLSTVWHERLATRVGAPREDAAAWALLEVLPAHPVITGPVAAAATGRAKRNVYRAIDALQLAGILLPLTDSPRNRVWEVAGLLELLERLEDGQLPVAADSPSHQ